MKLAEFDYELPKELIAQSALEKRDDARLMLVDLHKDYIEHLHFNHLTEILRKGDTVVVNDSRVVNARLFGSKPTGGKVELLVLEPFLTESANDNEKVVLDCLVKGKVRPGTEIELDLKKNADPNSVKNSNLAMDTKHGPYCGKIYARILDKVDGGRFKVEFNLDVPINDFLIDFGHIPLPPYIKQDIEKPERYQTVYSKNLGSVAAPTAGLHFTPEQLAELKAGDIRIAYVTLHISYGTFTPVRVENIINHKMEKEYAVLTKENAKLINEARKSSKSRLVAVGTTSIRTLETVALHSSLSSGSGPEPELLPWEGWSDLFIYPGFEFKAGIDILITNFHLPKSTLLMLVCAFAGKEPIFKAYNEAIEKKYRFYSLGDTMMIIK